MTCFSAIFWWLMGCVLLMGCRPGEPPDCEQDEETACFRGVYQTLLGQPVAGVETCAPLYPEVPCVVSLDDGTWKLPGLPLETNALMTATHEEYLPVIYPQHTSMDWYAWYKTAVSPWVMETNASNLDVELEPNKGHLIFIAWEGLNIDGENTPAVEGVSVAFEKDSPLVFYANGFGLADSDQTTTGGLGQGGAINLLPGTYNVTISGPNGICDEHSFSWALNDDSTIPVPIQAGYTTAIDVICP